jgi:hypothetical protein
VTGRKCHDRAARQAAAAQGGCGTSVRKFEHLPAWHTEPNGDAPPCPGMPCVRQRALCQAPSRAPSGTGGRGDSRTAPTTPRDVRDANAVMGARVRAIVSRGTAVLWGTGCFACGFLQATGLRWTSVNLLRSVHSG